MIWRLFYHSFLLDCSDIDVPFTIIIVLLTYTLLHFTLLSQVDVIGIAISFSISWLTHCWLYWGENSFWLDPFQSCFLLIFPVYKMYKWILHVTRCQVFPFFLNPLQWFLWRSHCIMMGWFTSEESLMPVGPGVVHQSGLDSLQWGPRRLRGTACSFSSGRSIRRGLYEFLCKRPDKNLLFRTPSMPISLLCVNIRMDTSCWDAVWDVHWIIGLQTISRMISRQYAT